MRSNMPLRVHCPSGCFIRMPSNRAGKIVRCPECKKTIRLGTVTKTEMLSGKPIPLSADPVTTPNQADTPIETFPSIDETSSDQPEIELPQISLDADQNQEQRPRLMLPSNLKPPSVRRRKSSSQDSPVNRRTKIHSKIFELQSVKLDEPDVTIPGNEIPLVMDSMETKAGLRRRVTTANADRAMLSRFFAICLCLVAAINLGPAVYFWIQWSQTFESTALPRWIYLQAFVAALHVIYAVYLVQIQDWSALKAVAIAMLVVAFVFGLVSTGLVAGGGQGLIGQFLEIPHVLTSKASIWCVAMLCLSTLMCYVGGRVSVNWQRTEQLLREITS